VHEPRAGKEDLASPKQVQVQPKAPRSAFMCFTDFKKNEILAETKLDKENTLKLVAPAWRALTSGERAEWEEVARRDKLRFVTEKAVYKGPWEQKKRRAKKHPDAPRRPMSAFLMYSQTRRKVVKKDNPDMSNTDVSRLLGEMWRNGSVADLAPYVDVEKRERADYKERIKTWKDKQARLDAASRTSHRKVQKMVDYAPPVHQYAHDSFVDPSMSFEPVRIHSVEDAAYKPDQRMFRSYNGPYHQPHRQAYPPAKDSFDYGPPLVPDSSIRMRHDYAEPEPFPAARRQRPPTSQGEDDANRYNGRSPYFQDPPAHSFNFYQFP
jgi:hypothetical protein